jgi:Golgi SNAP receptor complex protein 2|tara:strand:+ start:169 stop:396 length:228 start_codon:yes stop_codon:yes gene_type:complete
MAVLGSLGEQRSSLKGVQRKVLDIASTLGVSNSVLRAIESRQFWDKMLVYGGMLLTLALLWLVFVRMRRDVPLDE